MEKIKLSIEDKMFLIKDLSARLPYAITVEHTSGFRGTLHDITVHHMYDDNDIVYDAICYTDFFGDGDSIYIEYFKPYLFPLKSLSYIQKCSCPIGFTNLDAFIENEPWSLIEICPSCIVQFVNWCYKNHLDINGLIPKGLALDATNKNIY